ncbi:MAG: sugar ABC transporter substrate-binding protein [Rhizobiales bacterium]|nr:sugar ABC transporter substrate-binding protein [Hyphomicrobiales bacterium]
MRNDTRLAELLASQMDSKHSRRKFLQALAVLGLATPLTLREIIAARAENADAAAILANPHNFMNSFYTLNNDYFNQMDQGAGQAAAALNITESREINNGDVNVQKAHVENAPNLGIDGITMVAATEGSEIDLLRLVNQLKIPTVNNHTKAAWNTPLDSGAYYVAFHAPPNVTATKARSVQVFEKLGGKGNVVYIEGILGNPVEAERGHGFDLALAEYPGINLVARRPGGWSRTTTAPVIADILTAHDDIDAIIVSNDDSAIAVVSALEQRGLKALVSGCDAIPEMVELVASGRAFSTFAYGPAWLGAYSTVVVFDYINGWRPSVPERMMIFGGYILDTPEAAQKYKVLVDGETSPYDFLKMSKVLHPDDWNPQNLLIPMPPAEHWDWRVAKPADYTLPKEYAEAVANGEFERVTKLYAERFSSDPVMPVRELTSNKGPIVIGPY